MVVAAAYDIDDAADTTKRRGPDVRVLAVHRSAGSRSRKTDGGRRRHVSFSVP